MSNPSKVRLCSLALFLFFSISGAASSAHGGSQARGRIGAAAAGLHRSHSNAGSEPSLRPAPQLSTTPDLCPTEQGRGQDLRPPGCHSGAFPLCHGGNSSSPFTFLSRPELPFRLAAPTPTATRGPKLSEASSLLTVGRGGGLQRPLRHPLCRPHRGLSSRQKRPFHLRRPAFFRAGPACLSCPLLPELVSGCTLPHTLPLSGITHFSRVDTCVL